MGAFVELEGPPAGRERQVGSAVVPRKRSDSERVRHAREPGRALEAAGALQPVAYASVEASPVGQRERPLVRGARVPDAPGSLVAGGEHYERARRRWRQLGEAGVDGGGLVAPVARLAQLVRAAKEILELGDDVTLPPPASADRAASLRYRR